MHALGYAFQQKGDLREECDWAWSIVRRLRRELLEECELAERRLRKVERLLQQLQQQLQQLQQQLHASERANEEAKADRAAALAHANTSADKAADACVRAKAAEAFVKEADASEKKAVASAHAQGVREGMQRAAAGSSSRTAGGLAPVKQFRAVLQGAQEKSAARAALASTTAAADLENRAPHGPL